MKYLDYWNYRQSSVSNRYDNGMGAWVKKNIHLCCA